MFQPAVGKKLVGNGRSKNCPSFTGFLFAEERISEGRWGEGMQGGEYHKSGQMRWGVAEEIT